MKKIIAIVVWLIVIAWLWFFFMKSSKGAIYTGKTVSVDYVWSFPDGKVFDTSIEKVAKDNGLYNPQRTYAPLSFEVGGNSVIPGFGNAVNGMKIGETKKVTLEPKDGYGEIDPTKVAKIDRAMFQQANIVPQTGQTYQIKGQLSTVKEVGEKEVTIDTNNPMAGKTLVFEITLKSVDEGAKK
jgi:peptidylprolyl isomerase